MGKQITQQARGRGGPAFKVRRKGYRYRISYPFLNVEGIGKITKLINSSGHSAPLAEIEVDIKQDENISDMRQGNISEFSESKLEQTSEDKQTTEVKTPKSIKLSVNNINNKIKFIVPAAGGVYEGKEIYICKFREGGVYEKGDVVKLKNIKQGEKVFNIENVPGKGGKFLRSAGSSGMIGVKDSKDVEIIIKRRKLKLNENCRAIVGVVAGEGRKTKPFVKAGKKHHLMKSKGRKWHRTSAVKVNAVDHPFGSGRGKRIKSKIAKRNAPAGAKVGHIRPRQTGKRK